MHSNFNQINHHKLIKALLVMALYYSILWDYIVLQFLALIEVPLRSVLTLSATTATLVNVLG